jgi:hypothetical protein
MICYKCVTNNLSSGMPMRYFALWRQWAQCYCFMGNSLHAAINYLRHANFHCSIKLKTIELTCRCKTSFGPKATVGMSLLTLFVPFCFTG